MFTDHDNSGLELIHGLLDLIMKKINIKNDEKNGTHFYLKLFFIKYIFFNLILLNQ